MVEELVKDEMEGRLVPDESIPEEFEEKDLKPRRPFEIEKSSFLHHGGECSVFLPVMADTHDMWRGNQKFRKRIFASEEDARKEIKKYFES